MKGIIEKLTVGLIERSVDQVNIFAYYLGISENEIHACVDNGRLICSPLRADKNPTCGFYYQNGKLRFNDFAGYFHGDCYDVVGYRNLLNCRDSQDFAKVLEIVAKDFKLHTYANSTTDIIKMWDRVDYNKTKQKVVITVQPKEWGFEDEAYWNKYHISQQQLIKFRVFPVYSYWINEQLKYNTSYNDICYGYYDGIDKISGTEKWQLYHPYRTKVRFLTNYATLRSTANVKKAKSGVITKSIKDIIVLDLFNINAVSLAAEGILPTGKEIQKLHSFWETSYCLTDFDYVGIRAAVNLKSCGFKPLLLTNGRFGSIDYEAKDISDFIVRYGFQKTKDFIEYFKEELENFDQSDYYDFLKQSRIGILPTSR